MTLLHTAVAREAARLADAARALDPPRGVVATTDVAHLAGGHELVEGLERLLQRY
jgi:hypothetical protein